jgi:ATP-dependent Lhr-like helicase
MHRMNIGTITSDAVMDIRFLSGRRLGSIEENFVDGLNAGDTFVFAGKTLEFVRTRELTAYVRPSRKPTNFTPIWGGTRLPISESLGEAVRTSLALAHAGPPEGWQHAPELGAAREMAGIQAGMSRIPRPDELLVEIARTREGQHLFVYPFDGRLVHAGVAAIVALRLTRRVKTTFSTAFNDYGFELLTGDDLPLRELVTSELFSPEGAAADSAASVNMGQLARTQFREVARVAGLIFQSVPGFRKSGKQVRASSTLLYDVLSEFDPGNLLLEQARREVMERQFESSRLARTLRRLHESPLVVVETGRPTPLGLPLVVERIGARLTGESLLERIEKMRRAWSEPNILNEDPTIEPWTEPAFSRRNRERLVLGGSEPSAKDKDWDGMWKRRRNRSPWRRPRL